MDYEEAMVEEGFDDTEAADTLPEGIVEEEDESEEEFPEAEDLEIPDEEEEPEQPAEEEKPANEPGWIKQRVNKAVEKAVAAALAQQREEFEQQMRPLREKMMEDEAQELVRSRKVADIETARELVRLRQGQPAQAAAAAPEKPRNDRGQFASKEQIVSQAKTDARVEMLAKQADKIKANGGPDVIEEFSRNEEIKRRVINGELDMYDVARIMKGGEKRQPPAPTRSPNGASNVMPNAFMTMSSKEFARFERKIQEGGRYSIK